MEKSQIIDHDLVVKIWLTRGIECFFLSFRVSEMDRNLGFDQFLNAMGLEMICKGYLLAIHREKYKGLVEKEANEKINELAKHWGHDVKKLIKKIKKNIGEEKIQPFLEREFKGFEQKNKNLSKTVLSGIEAAYLECRYPVPQPFYKDKGFKVTGVENAFFDPLCSSDIHRFCYEFCRVILTDLKEIFGIGIPESWWNQKITDDAGRRFENLFFNSKKEDFIFDA